MSDSRHADRAMRRLKRGGAVRFFCLPYAGGASSAFVPLARLLPDSWDVMALDPPGHGSSPGPFLTAFSDLVAFYLDVLLPRLEPPNVLFGHSLGALAAWHLAVILEGRGRPPDLVIASGSPPPHIQERPRRYWFEMDDPEIAADLRCLGGIPEALLGDPEYMDYLLPILRADSRIIASYRAPGRRPIGAPLVALGGTEDPDLPSEALDGWGDYGHHVEFVRVAGGHMFPLQAVEETAACLSKWVARFVPSKGGEAG